MVKRQKRIRQFCLMVACCCIIWKEKTKRVKIGNIGGLGFRLDFPLFYPLGVLHRGPMSSSDLPVGQCRHRRSSPANRVRERPFGLIDLVSRLWGSRSCSQKLERKSSHSSFMQENSPLARWKKERRGKRKREKKKDSLAVVELSCQCLAT